MRWLGEVAKKYLHKLGKIVFQNIMHLKQFQMLSYFFTSYSVITYNYVFFASSKFESHQQMIFLYMPDFWVLFLFISYQVSYDIGFMHFCFVISGANQILF